MTDGFGAAVMAEYGGHIDLDIARERNIAYKYGKQRMHLADDPLIS
jgi:hypothetical protein